MKPLVFVAIALAPIWSANTATATGLPVGSPEEHGFDSAALADAVTSARQSGMAIHSLTVVRGSEVLLDVGFYPYDLLTLHDVASVTKSVTTTLIGIAAGDGALNLDAPVLSFFAGRAIENRDHRKDTITVRQLTQNLSGLACVGMPEEKTLAEMQASPDFVQFALDLPMVAEPGAKFDYCSPGMHLLSAILQAATGKTASEYAQEKLFGPLGISNVVWDADPQGVTRGWGDLHLVPADMVKLGLLWRGDGEWQGTTIVPKDWLTAATTNAVRSDRHEDYGYGFWVGPADEPIPYFFASGRAGQRILVAPALELIIVTTGGGFDPGDIVDPVVGALVDPARSLPPDTAAQEKLRAAIDAASAPPLPEPLPAPPPIAERISGKTYVLDPNPAGLEAIRLAFPGGSEARLTLTDANGAAERGVGLDGVYRWSVGANDIRYGVAGRWSDESTFVLDYNTIGDINAYTIAATFSDGLLEMVVTQRDEHASVRLTGHAKD